MILIGERVENGIKSGKIPMATSSNAMKKPFGGKKETNVVYGQKSCSKNDHHQSVGAVLISNPASVQQQQHGSQCKSDSPRRQITRISMPLCHALQHLLKVKLITLHDPPSNPNTSSPKYNPNAKCAHHSNSLGHDTNNCWAMKNKIQDMVDNKEI